MFDKKIYEKICTVSCTFEELENFVSGIDKKEFDLDNAFQKYYSLDCILSAIKKYKAKQINDKFLRYWANAYDWIIMSGFKTSCYKEKGNRSIKEIVVDEITEWLDSLSFFDCDEEWYDLDKYVECFVALDEIYQNVCDWDVAYTPTNEFCEENGDAWVLFINRKRKVYLKICYGSGGEYTIEGQEPWTQKDMDKAIQSLKENGYNEMPYGLCEE